MDRKRIEELLDGYQRGALDREALGELLDSLGDSASDVVWTEAMRAQWERSRNGLTSDQAREAFLLAEVQASAQIEGPPSIPQVRASRWRHLAVAAALTGLFAGGWRLWGTYTHREESASPVAASAHSVPLLDAAERVTLTLEDGTTVFLDAMGDGPIEVDASTHAVKGGDGLRYAKSSSSAAAAVYHTISTPRGGQFRITLSDGSRVWLNAASSLRFPVAFPSGAREVQVSGQAYFEVAPDKGRPFRVSVGDAQVEVLGTRFDIMSYADEAELRTTLFEGAVRFRNSGGETRLAPGQQSYAKGGEAPHVRTGVDLESVMAWRDGFLEFRGDDIGAVCRTLSRAYDITLAYEDGISERFHARFPRDMGLETVLKALEMTGKVRFERRGGGIWAHP